MDGDTEMNGTQATRKAGSTRKSGIVSSKGTPDFDEDNGSKRGFAAINAPQASPPAKDLIPGTSTFVANPSTSAPSKKRKQPSSGAAPTNATTQANPAPAHTTRTKYLPTTRRQTENSVMSFEESGARLHHGQLRADDGTTLAVNGECSSLCIIVH